MNWLQKIADQIEFDQTLNVLSQYLQKLPGEWRMIHSSKLNDGEMNIAYKGTGVKKPFDEYQLTVWFMHNPNKTPAYNPNIGHHSIRFGCAVFRVEDRKLEDIGFARQELDTPKSVADYAWSRIENDGWDNEEQENSPVTPASPISNMPEITPSPSVSNRQLQLALS